MLNKKEFFVLINAVLFLTACEDNNDKILKELKKINHRQAHQYSMQLQLRREDDYWKAALTNQEKIEHIKFQNEMRKLDIKHFKEEIVETLQKLKKLNKKGFTDKFPIRIRAYALSEETSFFIRLLLMTLTPSNNDFYIYEFQIYREKLIFYSLRLIQVETFPSYLDEEYENTLRDACPSINTCSSTNEAIIDMLIKDHSK